MKSFASKPNPKVTSVSAYIRMFPKDVAIRLSAVRSIVKKCAPSAEEVISYGMPAYKDHGILLYFAGYKNHMGLYLMPSTIRAFEVQLRAYKTSKGTIQVPHDSPLPSALIVKMVKYRVKDHASKVKGV